MLRAAFLGLILLMLGIGHAHATFSIIACEPETGQCGVAVATHNLAVGHGAPFVEAKLGAGISQFETNPCHKPAIIEALRNNQKAKAAVTAALESESACADGLDNTFRQIGVVSMSGTASVYTGKHANEYAGARAEGLVAVQGNGLASDVVLMAMWSHFYAAKGSLAERLLVALEAGHAAGGQSIGVMSAALLVATPEGWPVDIDLRVDFAPSTAIVELREAFNASYARQLLFRSQRVADKGTADGLIKKALQLAPTWDRIWLRTARMAKAAKNHEVALYRFCHFNTLNPIWADRLDDEFDFKRCNEEARVIREPK